MASPGTSGWRGPMPNNMARLNWHAKYPNPLQIYGWMICFQINCAWNCLSMLVKNLVNWWKLARNSRFICGMQQMKPFKLYMFTCKLQAWDLSGQSTSNSTIIYQISRHEIFVILLEVAVNLLLQLRKCTSREASFREVTVLIRSQRQLACEGIYRYYLVWRRHENMSPCTGGQYQLWTDCFMRWVPVSILCWLCFYSHFHIPETF